MDLYLDTSAGPYEVGRQAVALASMGVTFSLVALSVIGLVVIVSWGVSLVRQKAAVETKERRYDEVIDAIRRSQEAPASEQERVEQAARFVP